MKRFLSAILIGCMIWSPAVAQNSSFDDYFAKKTREFNNYSGKKQQEFENYRRKCNQEYADYLKKKWIGKKASPKIDRPKDEPSPPVVFNERDNQVNPDPIRIHFGKVIPVPAPIPQPRPVVPINEIPLPAPRPMPDQTPIAETPVHHFSFYGTQETVRLDKTKSIKIGDVDEESIADAWIKLSGDDYTNLIVDCLELRDKHKLNDWAYLKMLKGMAESFFGPDTDEAILLTAYVYCQSGYKMRLAVDEDSKLNMLYATRHTVFDHPYFNIDGDTYYCLDSYAQSIKFADVGFPKESSMSLLLDNEPILNYLPGPTVTRTAKQYDDVKTTVCVNKNLLDFFTEYPNSKLGDNFLSRWAIYGNTPLAKDVKDQLYPPLKAAIQNCDDLNSANKLLNYMQTGFEYELDDTVWGGDRAFFAEESLHYPYCDCEDRAILFSRLIRDLLGLKVILVYYPGHLATAVEFPDKVYGDYIEYDGRRFTVCDPTCIGAPVGATMKYMDNATAHVILLD